MPLRLRAGTWRRPNLRLVVGFTLLTMLAAFDFYLVATQLVMTLPYRDGISWWTVDLAHPYELAKVDLTSVGAFRYAPPIAILMGPLSRVPWPLFVAGFTAVQLAIVVWLAGRMFGVAILLPPVLTELFHANIELLMAAVVVAGFRRPMLWSFLVLTKVTPGVALLWFLVRREWRALAEATGATVLLAALSFVIAPHLWPQVD